MNNGLKLFVEENIHLIDDEDYNELYRICPISLKDKLLELLSEIDVTVDRELVLKTRYLIDNYTYEELVDIAEAPIFTTDVNVAVEFILDNWDMFYFHDCGYDSAPSYKEFTTTLNDSLNEELLTEKTDSRKEVSSHAFSDANKKPYRLSGLKGKIIDKYGEPLRLLCISIKNNDIQEGEALFADICNNDQEDPWTTHHIDGLHKNSSIRDLSNLALVRRSLHKKLTDNNKLIAERCLEGVSITGDADVDKLVCRLLVVLYNQDSDMKITPSQIFRIPVHNVDKLMNNTIPETVSKEFYNRNDRSTSDIIRLIDLKNFQK